MKTSRKWKGRIELQGVSLSILSFFKDEHASRNLARTVKGHKGILGAAVSCSDYGGTDLIRTRRVGASYTLYSIECSNSP